MKIAVNTRALQADNKEGMGYYIHEIFSRITQQHPEHEFLFLFDRPWDNRITFSKNVTPVMAGPQANSPLSWKWWYDVKIPALLKKYKADVFVSGDRCSLRTTVPQCLVIDNLAFLHHPSFIKKTHLYYYKHYMPAFLKKANQVITVSEFTKIDIIANYKTGENKIDVVYKAVNNSFYPITYAEQEAVQQQYTEGKSYFLYAGVIHPRRNLTNLLKAFSIFKKRQQSNWKLVLAGKTAPEYDHFNESLKSYKYRNDVVLTGHLDEAELAKIMGAAHGLVYPSLGEGFGLPVLEAMRSHVPVITSANSSMQEIAGDAALYVNPADQNDIADKIMTLYKDERLRAQLIEKGKKAAEAFDWDRSAEKFWNSLYKAVPLSLPLPD